MATKKKSKRKFIDWESIEPLYRAGTLSNYDICRQYAHDHKHSQTCKPTLTEAAIRKYAKAKGWQKNLANKVKNQVQENLVRNEVRIANQGKSLSDQEIVERAAETGSNVVLRHRNEIKRLLAIEDDLLAELSGDPKKLHFATYKGEILSKKVGLTVTEKASTLKNLTAVRAQRILLERQAYNLDDDSNPYDQEKIIIKDNISEEEAAEICKNVLG